MSTREEEYLRRMKALGYEPDLRGMDDEDIEWELSKMEKNDRRRETEWRETEWQQPLRTVYRPVDPGLKARILRMFGQPYDESMIPEEQKFYLNGWYNGEDDLTHTPSLGETRRSDEPTNYWDTVLKRSRDSRGTENWFKPMSEPSSKDNDTNWWVDPLGMFPGGPPQIRQAENQADASPTQQNPGNLIIKTSNVPGSGENSVSDDDDDKRELTSITEFKKRYGSMINEKAKELGVDPDLLGATIWVESNGSGFSNGKMKIRFENHYFINDAMNDYGLLSGRRWDDQHEYRKSANDPWKPVHSGNLDDEYSAFELAKQLNPEVAHTSISMGLGQIMGENYKAAGYNSAKEMFDDFSRGHTPQINGMVSFIRNDENLLKALQKNDLHEFVKLYNGKANVEAYLKKLQEGIPMYQNN